MQRPEQSVIGTNYHFFTCPGRESGRRPTTATGQTRRQGSGRAITHDRRRVGIVRVPLHRPRPKYQQKRDSGKSQHFVNRPTDFHRPVHRRAPHEQQRPATEEDRVEIRVAEAEKSVFDPADVK